ncbi:MAG: hypothetical protein ABIO39_08355 [Caulobacteraceae bacterium]
MAKTPILAAAFALVVSLAAPLSARAADAAGPPGRFVKPACDRACLEDFANRYMAALAAHNPNGLPLSDRVRFTENNVELPIGEGLWGTNNGLATKPLIVADPKMGQVGYYGLVLEGEDLVYYAMRMKVDAGRIAEVETIVNRLSYGQPRGDPTKFAHDPLIATTLKPEERRPREQLVDIANGYFSTLQLNDGTLHTEFDPKCQRLENGQGNAGDPNAKNEVFKLYCGEQFKLGYYHANTRVRDRAYLVVDEEKGLVLARGFIDHAGVERSTRLTDGRAVPRGHIPHTWSMLELFKIIDGKITRIEAVFFAVPYYMPSPWNVAPRRFP